MATLVFEDGPAKDQQVETSIEPSWTRWHVALKSGHGWWWVIDHVPPEDDGVVVTRYDCAGVAVGEDGEMKYTFAVKEEKTNARS